MQEVSYFRMLFIECGPIGYLLWFLSIVTVAVIIQYFVTIRRAIIMPDTIRSQINSLFENKQYREVIDLTAQEPSYLSYIVHAALAESPHGYASMERAMEEASEERTTKLLRRIEWLNLLGNISPMLGLMGTVWGMIGAFIKIWQVGGTPDPADLANSIGTALVTTLLGLAVAIPSLSVYAIMRNRIDAMTSEAMVASQDLISAFRPGKKA